MKGEIKMLKFRGITKEQFEDIFVEEIICYELQDCLEETESNELFEVVVTDGIANIYTYSNGSSTDFAYDVELSEGTLDVLKRNVQEIEEE